MKRVQIEPWSIKEKLCLATAVLHSGDQNWMSVSRHLRIYGETNRPLDWYSQKQCAVQYENLLNNAGTTKRKKRSEKGVETVDIPGETIVRKLTKERIEELKLLLGEDKADYLRMKKLQEEVDSGKLDDRLDEIEIQLEEEIRKDKEKCQGDLSTRLSLLSSRHKSLADITQDADSSDSNMEVDLKPSPTPTSPLLTSLLQSPSPAILHRSSSTTPTISNLLHSVPSAPRVQDSPTLSKLLESPTSQILSSLVKTSTVETISEVPATTVVKNEKKPSSLDQDESATSDLLSEVKNKSIVDGFEDKERKSNVVRRLDLDTSPPDTEKEDRSSLIHTQDSDTLEEQLETEIELDSQAVDMIVMGPNQSAVIAVHHDTSSEQLEDDTLGGVKEHPGIVLAKEISPEEISEEIVVMNEEEISKPVEDALKMINDATIVVAEADQIVEIGTRVIDEDISEENDVKNLVEEQVIIEEVITEDLKDVAMDNLETEKNDVVGESNVQELVLDEIKHEVIEEVVTNENVEEVIVDLPQKISSADLVSNTLSSDSAIKKENTEEIKTSVVSKEKELKEDQAEVKKNTVERPKKVGRKRKSSSKEIKEATSTNNTKDKESLAKISEEAIKESLVISTSKQSATTPNAVPPLSKSSDIILASTEVATASPTTKEIPTSLPPPENVISDFKVPRSDTPSTTDEDNDPATCVSKRGKTKRASGFDSKPSSPCVQSYDEGSKEFRAWKKSIMLVYNPLSTHKYASIFLRPITNERARGYHSVVHCPMDLSTIKKNIEIGNIRSTVEFQRDVLMMFLNAIMYNNSNTEIFEMASVMQRECIQHFQLIVEAIGEGVPFREDAMSNEKTSRTRVKTDDSQPSRKRGNNSISEDNKSLAPTKRKKQSL